MNRRVRWATLLTVVAIAAYVVLFRLGQYGVPYIDRPGPLPRSRLRIYDFMFQLGRLLDIYTAFYPSMVYGARSVRAGGHGLWWNPYQNCGQPFLGRISTAQLYPLFMLPALVAGPLALWVIPFLHLIIAGVSAYLLCRELGAGRAAALCGAITFELGNVTMETAVWQPYASGAYVWLPAAMLFCERALRRPTARNAIGLGVTLALALLAGFPQTVFYTYLLIALRVSWELTTRRTPHRFAVLAAVGTGLVLAPLVAAVQLIPAVEVGRASVRSGALSLSDLAPGGFLDWRDFRIAVGARASVFQPLVLVPCMLGGGALLARATRRPGLFYVFAGLLFFVLALGPTTPLFGWYLRLPFAAAFRWPQRFMWLTSFCVAVVAALGAEALLSKDARSPSWSLARALTMVAVLGGFHLLAPDGLRPLEWVLGAAATAACLTAAVAPAVRNAACAVALGAVVLNLVAVPTDAWQSQLTDGASVFAYAPVFTRLRARMTAQDRVYFSFDIPFSSDFGLQAKSASLFEVPSFFDYEPQVARRYADFFTMLRTGAPLGNAGAMPHILGGNASPRGFNRRVLDLAAGRYVLAEAIVDNTTTVLDPAPPLLEDDGDVRLYGNPQALPRARYVPRVEVVEDERTLLERLAFGPDDPRQVALVEAPPPSGFTGLAGVTGPGTAEFLLNDPEHLVLHVEAPARGFLVLADQYFPGWEATVDGEPRPIVRANYVFRMVEVPAGASRVEFRYAPGSVRLGAGVSALTLLGIGGVLASSFARRRVRAT